MNVIEQALVRRVDTLLEEFDKPTMEVIGEGVSKSKSTSMHDLMTARDIDDAKLIRIGSVRMQIDVLMDMLEVQNNRKK